MNRDEHTQQGSGAMARTRGFFERAAERVRNATRDMRERAHGRMRDREGMRSDYGDRDERWFGRNERERTMHRPGSPGGERGAETYRESAREFGRDWARAHYGRERDEREHGGYGQYGGYGGSQYMRDADRYERDEAPWDRNERQPRRRW